MIRDPECPYCYGRMVPDMGPRCDPTDDGNVDIEQVERCEVCKYERAVHQHTWTDTEIAERVAAVAALRGVDDLDARANQLAALGYVIGKRWWPRAEA